jgi:hypothetical protein
MKRRNLTPTGKALGIAYLVGAVPLFYYAAVTYPPVVGIGVFACYVFAVPHAFRQVDKAMPGEIFDQSAE